MAQKLDPQRSGRFTTIFEQKMWGSEGSVSGAGSRPGTDVVVDALEALDVAISKYGVRTISDVPCGDFAWMGALLKRHPGIDYVGYDIVEPLIIKNRLTNPGVQFELLDLVSSRPRKSDLVFSKELLIHLPYWQIDAALQNIRSSGSKYFMASNHFGAVNTEFTSDIISWGREINLLAPPFSFPAPLWRNGYHALWNVSDIRFAAPPLRRALRPFARTRVGRAIRRSLGV